MKKPQCIFAFSLSLVLSFSTASFAKVPYPVEWARQLGTGGTDWSGSVTTDTLGNVYISGGTWGSLDGPNAGEEDAFLSKYDAAGTLLWTEQLGTSGQDESCGVATDAVGNVYISGSTLGSLGGPHAGSLDAFVSKYDTTGTLLWTKQLGTSGWDSSESVTTDSLGNIYISGRTTGSLGAPYSGGIGDAFVSKYDTAGTLLWTKQLGTSDWDDSESVATDSLSNVYILGRTDGSLGGPNAGEWDVFVSKYDSAGTLQWTEQLGTPDFEYGYGMTADTFGNVYISGKTKGSLGGVNAGGNDAFVSKYDTSGTLLWTEQLGTTSFDTSSGVTTDSLGNVYISGSTLGRLGGPNAGGYDVFVSKYDPTGTLLWTEQIGTSGSEGSGGVTTDAFGNVYISGSTRGSLDGPNMGDRDAFLIKLSAVTEPSAGDYDGDGDLDSDDLSIWQSTFGSTTELDADGNNNGIIDAADYTVWRDHLGGSSTAATLTVPEPSMALLVGLAVSAIALHDRRSHAVT